MIFIIYYRLLELYKYFYSEFQCRARGLYLRLWGMDVALVLLFLVSSDAAPASLHITVP